MLKNTTGLRIRLLYQIFCVLCISRQSNRRAVQMVHVLQGKVFKKLDITVCHFLCFLLFARQITMIGDIFMALIVIWQLAMQNQGDSLQFYQRTAFQKNNVSAR